MTTPPWRPAEDCHCRWDTKPRRAGLVECSAGVGASGLPAPLFGRRSQLLAGPSPARAACGPRAWLERRRSLMVVACGRARRIIAPPGSSSRHGGTHCRPDRTALSTNREVVSYLRDGRSRACRAARGIDCRAASPFRAGPALPGWSSKRIVSGDSGFHLHLWRLLPTGILIRWQGLAATWRCRSTVGFPGSRSRGVGQDIRGASG